MDEIYVKAVNEQFHALMLERTKLLVQLETVNAAISYWENKTKQEIKKNDSAINSKEK